MKKIAFGALFGLILTASAFAAVQVTPVGSIDYGDIVRTLDKDQGLVCFSVRGSKGGDVSCVKRTVLGGQTVSVVGNLDYGDIKRIYDDVFKVACTATRSSESASISCL